MSERPSIAYKVLTADQMEALETDGFFMGAPVDIADGYIHLSTSDQIDETLFKHFGRQANLHIAAVDLEALGAAVRWEPSRGGALFPHIYGELPLDAVIAYGPLEKDESGKTKLPVAG